MYSGVYASIDIFQQPRKDYAPNPRIHLRKLLIGGF
jgi:hypothetical protein